jgi:branched-chain amino acid transport system substrate-binding protein
MKKEGSGFLGIYILFSVIICLFLGPRAQADPGVTKDEINVGLLTILTGPRASDGVETKRTVDLFVEQINAAGGIHGRKLKITYEDDGYDTSKTVAGTRKLIGNDKVFCILGPSGMALALAIRPIVQEEKVPTLVMLARADKLVDPHTRYLFQGNISPYGESEALVGYAKKTYNPKSVGIFVLKGEYGVSLVKALEPVMRENGIKPALIETCPAGVADLSSQLLRLKAAKPDILFFALLGKETAMAIRQSKELGLNQKILGTALCNIVGVAPAAGEAIEGLEFVDGMAGSPDFPKGKFKEFMEAYHAKYPKVTVKEMGTVSFDLYAGISVFAEAMRRVGKDLTREKLVDALDSLRDYDPATRTPITFTPQDHRGTKYYNVFRYDKEGRRLFVSGPHKITTEPPVAPAEK